MIPPLTDSDPEWHTDLRKAAEMALEALEDASERLSLEFTGRSEYEEEIETLRQTLLQLEREQHCRYCNGIGRVVCDGRCLPEQEPVAWEKNYDIACSLLRQAHDILATTQYPIKRPWVSLTDEEIDYIWGVTPPDYENFFEFPRAIEAKLKEKNNG